MKEYFESYSNLAYNAVGIIAYLVHGDLLFCMALQVLGIGSFTYHWHKRSPIYLFDWYAMALVNTVIAGIHFDSSFAWIALIIGHVLYGYLFMGRTPDWRLFGREIPAVYTEVAFSSAIAFTAIGLNRSIWTFIVIFLVFLIALVLRSKDEDPKQLKFHDSVWHSIWHFITAGGFYLAVYLDI